MARQTSAFTFTGKFRDLIGYRRNGKYFYRSMPDEVRQTTATKRAALNFGAASRKGRLIRSAFVHQLDIACDHGMINRLNSKLIKARRNDHATIAGFQFNQSTGTDRFFPITPVFTNDGQLHIPAQQLAQFKGITGLEVKLIAARIDFTTRRVTGTDTDIIHVDLTQPFEGADLQVSVQGKGTLVVTLQIQGLRASGNPSGNRRYQAADIIAIVEEGTDKVIRKPVSSYQQVLHTRIVHTINLMPAIVIQRE